MRVKENNPKYTIQQLILLFLLLDKSSQGRYMLSKYLNVSLAKARVLLNLLVDKSLAETSGQSSGRLGTRLTIKGKRISQKIKRLMIIDLECKIFQISNNFIPPENDKICLALLSMEDFETKGVYERDIAVRSGANGSITLLRRQINNWIFPDDSQQTVAEFKLTEKSVNDKYNTAIIVFGKDIGSICTGTVAIAYYHLEIQFESIFSPHFEL